MRYSDNPFKEVEMMVDAFDMRPSRLNRIVFDYRVDLLKEEMKEIDDAVDESDPEGIVDGHVDLIVVAIGNLAIFGIDVETAFDKVMTANAAKIRGKRVESDPDGVSIAKPEGWNPPDHSSNHGELDAIFRTT